MIINKSTGEIVEHIVRYLKVPTVAFKKITGDLFLYGIIKLNTNVL